MNPFALPPQPEQIEHARRYLLYFLQPGGITELRAFDVDRGYPRVMSGYYDDIEALVEAAWTFRRRPKASM